MGPVYGIHSTSDNLLSQLTNLRFSSVEKILKTLISFFLTKKYTNKLTEMKISKTKLRKNLLYDFSYSSG